MSETNDPNVGGDGGGGGEKVPAPDQSNLPTSFASEAVAPEPQTSSFVRSLKQGVLPADVESARASKWYPLFRKVTMASEIIPLPQEFSAYMTASGPLVLPRCPADMELHSSDPRFVAAPPDFDETGYYSDDSWGDEGADNTTGANPETKTPGGGNDEEDVEDEESSSEDEEPMEPPCFAELERSIKVALRNLGGNAFSRSDWTAPNDARWVSGSVKVTTPGHVFLLWKSSDAMCAEMSQLDKYWDRENTPAAVARDAESEEKEAFSTSTHNLILRRWVDLFPSMIFKCIVADGQVIAISQKDTSTAYDHLKARKEGFRNLILQFHRRKVANVYPRPHYVYDAYIDSGNRVSVLDFDPVSKYTDFGLFTPTELQALYKQMSDSRSSSSSTPGGKAAPSEEWMPELRLSVAQGMRPSSDMYYGLPKDLLDRGLTTADDHSQKIRETVRSIMHGETQ